MAVELEELPALVKCAGCDLAFESDVLVCDCCFDCGDCCECNTCPSCMMKVHSDNWHYNCGADGLCEGCCTADEGGPGEKGTSTSEWGISERPGWEVRGVTVSLVGDSADWPQWWPEIDLSVDPVQAMCDFYLLEFVSSNVMAMNVDGALWPDSLPDVVAQARGALDGLVTRLEPCLRAYIDMVVGGELRHHRAIEGGKKVIRPKAWTGWKEVRQQAGSQALLDAAELFMENAAANGYMGPNWANAARVLHARETRTIDALTCVDRSFSLQHNGGCLLNKLPWATDNRPGWKVDYIQPAIGPAHTASPPVWPVLLAGATSETHGLFRRYWSLAGQAMRKAGEPVELVPNEQDGYTGTGYVIPRVDEPDYYCTWKREPPWQTARTEGLRLRLIPTWRPTLAGMDPILIPFGFWQACGCAQCAPTAAVLRGAREQQQLDMDEVVLVIRGLECSIHERELLRSALREQIAQEYMRVVLDPLSWANDKYRHPTNEVGRPVGVCHSCEQFEVAQWACEPLKTELEEQERLEKLGVELHVPQSQSTQFPGPYQKICNTQVG